MLALSLHGSRSHMLTLKGALLQWAEVRVEHRRGCGRSAGAYALRLQLDLRRVRHQEPAIRAGPAIQVRCF